MTFSLDATTYKNAYDASYNLLQKYMKCIDGNTYNGTNYGSYSDSLCDIYNNYKGGSISALDVPLHDQLNLTGNILIQQLKTGTTNYIALQNRTFGNTALEEHSTKLNDLRTKLDHQMEKVLLYDTSLMNENRTIFDSTVYTTIIWTILASSVVYYAFTKL
jgi:hypothetical protein